MARAQAGTGPAVTLVGMQFSPLIPMPIEAWAERSPRTRWPLVLLLIVLLIGLAGGITGCGGGDPDDADGRQHIGPPDCLNHPETCT